MKAEIVAVGTELLLGQIANTNAAHVSSALATIGVDVYFHTTVGDNHERMREVIGRAMDRADATIVTGGLGPTPDDITREVVAELTERKLVRDERLAQLVRDIFAKMKREMPESNLRQADLPEGGRAIDPVGTAPGFWIDHGGKLLFALPGVPWEMTAMLDGAVLPELRARTGDQSIVSREVLVIGVGESATHQRIGDIVDAQTNPTIAYRAGGGQVRVRISAKASSEADALALIGPVEDEIRSRLGDDAISGDSASLPDELGRLLREQQGSVALAESLTGGMIAAQMTEAAGASDFFKGSAVVYATESKRDVVNVPESVLDGPGAVSDECARSLAEGARNRFRADLGLGVTGVAGPSEQEGQPVGTIYVAAALQGRTESRHVRGYGDRDNIRHIAATAALDLGRRLLLAQGR